MPQLVSRHFRKPAEALVEPAAIPAIGENDVGLRQPVEAAAVHDATIRVVRVSRQSQCPAAGNGWVDLMAWIPERDEIHAILDNSVSCRESGVLEGEARPGQPAPGRNSLANLGNSAARGRWVGRGVDPDGDRRPAGVLDEPAERGGAKGKGRGAGGRQGVGRLGALLGSRRNGCAASEASDPIGEIREGSRVGTGQRGDTTGRQPPDAPRDRAHRDLRPGAAVHHHRELPLILVQDPRRPVGMPTQEEQSLLPHGELGAPLDI